MPERQRVTGSKLAATLEDFKPRRLPSTLATGLAFAVVNALLTVALMSLIFTDSLEEAITIGIGIGLATSAVLAIVIAGLSGFPGMYAAIQDNSAAILGLAAASIASSVAATQAIDSVIAMMALTSLSCGIVFLTVGFFGLGQIARFVPFPVIGGVLAGTGYLVLGGSLNVLWDGSLFSADAGSVLWPGVALAVVFFVASRRAWASQVFLWILLGGMAVFHIGIRAAGVGQQRALERAWLLGPFPDGGLWPGPAFDAVRTADWSAIVSQWPSMVTILVIVPISMLLLLSALEIATKVDVEAGTELRATGWANVAAAVLGGPPGYFFVSDTMIAHRLVGPRRGPAIVSGLGMFGIVLLGGTVLEFVPQFVVGGLLLFIGIDFLYEWLWVSRRRMTRLDYAITVLIVAIVATVGFLPGAAAGVVAAIGLFVYRYSRTDVVKHHLTAAEYQSNIERPLEHAVFLQAEGDAVLALELQGFIFFGTASRVLDELKGNLAANDRLRFVIFDFRRVTGIDSSAVALFERIALLAGDNDLKLLLSGLRPAHRAQFSSILASHDGVREEADLDHAMAWCEDRMLEQVDVSVSLRSLPQELVERLEPYLDSRLFVTGERLMTRGDPSPGMFLITSGRATVVLEDRSGSDVRLRTLLEGTVIGEISLYRNEPCTATVVAELDCRVLHLSPTAFDRLCTEDTGTAATLHMFVARALAGRVGHANRSIRALHD